MSASWRSLWCWAWRCCQGWTVSQQSYLPAGLPGAPLRPPPCTPSATNCLPCQSTHAVFQLKRVTHKHALIDTRTACPLPRVSLCPHCCCGACFPVAGFVDPGPANLVALTEGIHSKEALELVREHMLGVMGAAASNKFSTELIKMSKFQMAQVRHRVCWARAVLAREACWCLRLVVGRQGCVVGRGGVGWTGRDHSFKLHWWWQWQGRRTVGGTAVTLVTAAKARTRAPLLMPTRPTLFCRAPVSACAGVCCVHHVWLLPAPRGQALPAGVGAGHDRHASRHRGGGREAGAAVCTGGVGRSPGSGPGVGLAQAGRVLQGGQRCRTACVCLFVRRL